MNIMPAIHIIFKDETALFLKFLIVIPHIHHNYTAHIHEISHCYSTLCHNYTTHIPELFALLFHMSATTLSHDVMGQLTTNATPIPHLHTNKNKQYTCSIPAVFQPLFQPNLPPTNGKVDATPR